MIEIDCRKCVNADLEADCCKLYGNNPDTAVRECAADEFVNYKEVNKNPDYPSQASEEADRHSLCYYPRSEPVVYAVRDLV